MLSERLAAMTRSDLIEKLEKAEGPDRELDRSLSETFGRKNDFGVLICAGYLGIGDFTSSVDAAVRLCERVLPGHGYDIARCEQCHATIWEKDKNGNFVSRTYQVPGATLPIALCIAILKALQAKGE